MFSPECSSSRSEEAVTVAPNFVPFMLAEVVLPVRWDKTVIVVMNEVRVSSPYLPESVVGGTPAANERVRKVLELERKRLQTRNSGQ
ncbi:hypothetical protein BC332_13531 [Capsicum chinense]|nr:putative auxin-induced protein 5NG4-like [Capsicum annuum]PHU17836.1 hypothetical protein BC332_13531 [Capsicum chinense]